MVPICPETEQLDGFAAGRLDEGIAADIQLHLRSCSTCAAQLGEINSNLQICDKVARALRREISNNPQTIAGFRILREIGRGGMGVVFEAEQDNPRRRVALKVLGRGAASEDAIRRFRHEAQVLARLRHPGIAQIYAAGIETRLGADQPYFALELVHGRPLRQYAEEAGLDTRARLALIVQVCEAVEHAHQRGVIHRDLKPGNILVTNGPTIPDSGSHPADPNAAACPKVLDFGVARLTEADVQASTLHTQAGQLLGTLPYMSPEQLAGDPHDLDTRSDVYSLGVVTYELIAGRLPYELPAAVADMARVIREVEPAPLRSIDPSLRGDLETIVGHALEKDPARRYHSAAALGTDIRRFLNHEPILARPPSAGYILSKFARRHRGLVGAGAAVLGILLAATAFSSWQAIRATRAEKRAVEQADRALRAEQTATAQRDVALAVRSFLGDLLRSPDPLRSNLDPDQARNASLADLVNLAAAQVDAVTNQPPEVELEIRQILGETYTSLAQYDRAEPHLLRANDLAEELHGAGTPTYLDSQYNWAAWLHLTGRSDEAELLLRTLIEIAQSSLGPDHPWTNRTTGGLCRVLIDQGRFQEAEPLLNEIANLPDNDKYDYRVDRNSALSNLANIHYQLGRFDQAEAFWLQALAGDRRLHGPDAFSTVATELQLAAVYDRQGRHDESEPLKVRAYEYYRSVFGPQHRRTLSAANNLAALYHAQRRWDEAEPLMRYVTDEYQGQLGTTDIKTLTALNNLAAILLEQGKPVEAEPLAAQAAEGALQHLGEDRWQTGVYIKRHGQCLTELGRYEEAEQQLLRAKTLLEKLLDPTHPAIIQTAAALDDLYSRCDSATELGGPATQASDGGM